MRSGRSIRTHWRKVITEYTIPYANSSPRGIVWGPDGDVWFTDIGNGSIGQLDPSNHAIVEYPIPTANSGPTGITVGSDGNLWFTEINSGKIGKISPTTHAIVEFPLSTTTSRPTGIVSGPDGDLYVAEAEDIAQIVPSTHAISEFPVAGRRGIRQPDDGRIGVRARRQPVFRGRQCRRAPCHRLLDRRG